MISDFSGVDLFLNDGSGKFTDVTAKLVDNHFGGWLTVSPTTMPTENWT